jgi:glyoxylase-like metal-dependent hydrolase (beta-lactamase superfamily II)
VRRWAPMTSARPALIRSRRRLRRLACSPPEPVADGVWLLRGGLIRTMNVLLLRDEQAGGFVVFDAGEKGMPGPIAAAASALGGMSRVVLGHGDTDHRGAAPALRALGSCAIRRGRPLAASRRAPCWRKGWRSGGTG